MHEQSIMGSARSGVVPLPYLQQQKLASRQVPASAPSRRRATTRVASYVSDLAGAFKSYRMRGDQSLIVRTTDDVGRLLTVGSFISFAICSSYCASVFTGSFARICTTV
jgi:hypothetical protein